MWDSRNRDDTVGGALNKRLLLRERERALGNVTALLLLLLILCTHVSLHCTAATHCTVYHCFSLHCTAAPHCTVYHCTALICSALLPRFLGRGLHPSSVVRKASGCSAQTNYLFIQLSIHDNRRAAKRTKIFFRKQCTK